MLYLWSFIKSCPFILVTTVCIMDRNKIILVSILHFAIPLNHLGYKQTSYIYQQYNRSYRLLRFGNLLPSIIGSIKRLYLLTIELIHICHQIDQHQSIILLKSNITYAKLCLFVYGTFLRYIFYVWTKCLESGEWIDYYFWAKPR